VWALGSPCFGSFDRELACDVKSIRSEKGTVKKKNRGEGKKTKGGI
jgi:hypothetical protein